MPHEALRPERQLYVTFWLDVVLQRLASRCQDGLMGLAHGLRALQDHVAQQLLRAQLPGSHARGRPLHRLVPIYK